MINVKEEIAQVKRDLRSYSYHENKIHEIENELEALLVKINGVSSVAAKDVVLENAGNPYSDYRIQLMMEKDQLINERNKHLAEIERLDAMLKKIPEKEREILVDIYVRSCNISNVALNLSRSKSKLKRDIDKSIKKMLFSKR